MPHPQFRADPVLLECPACGAAESADPAIIADGPTIVCRNCGETWPSAPGRRRRMMSGSETAGRELIEAERRPLITFSDGAEKAWALKVEGDILPEQPPERSRAPMVAAATAAALFITAFIGGREAAVAAIPDLAGLYSAIGLPVNLDGLSIEAVEARLLSGEDAEALRVRGEIRNIAATERSLPPLVAYFPGPAGEAEALRFELPTGVLAAGQKAEFELTIDHAPPHSEEIAIRFLRASEIPDGT